MTIDELREQLKSYPGDLKISKKILDDLIHEIKNRPKGIKYKKSIVKEKILFKELDRLIYSNFNLSNLELIKRLNISKVHFYRLKLNIKAKELREKYKKQSLFKII